LLMTMLKVTLEPELTLVTVALLSMLRSARGVTVMLWLSVLLPGVVSVVPAGVVTVALLMIEPVALPSAVAAKVMVTRPPLGSVVTVPFKTVPVKAALAAPWMLMMLPPVRPAGSASRKVAPSAALGPALLITRLKVTVSPALTVVTVALLSMLRSATGLTINVAVAATVLVPTDVLSEPAGIVLVPV
jgi:hypothetical protein